MIQDKSVLTICPSTTQYSSLHHIVTQYQRVCVCVGSLLHIWVNVSLTEATLGQCKCCWQAEEMMWNMQTPETTRLDNQSTHQFDISSKNSTTDFVRYREATAITQDTSNLTSKKSRNDSIIYTFFHITGKSTTAFACCIFPQFCSGLGLSRHLLFSAHGKMMFCSTFQLQWLAWVTTLLEPMIQSCHNNSMIKTSRKEKACPALLCCNWSVLCQCF